MSGKLLRQRPRGFTLVELLVVIGIIAVLIGILLPALNKARKSAKTMQCSSNMRQIAMGMITYINDNKGRFPPGEVATNDSFAYGARGWNWANELVLQKYVQAPNMFSQNGTGPVVLTGNSAFVCPEGSFTEANLFSPNPLYPSDGNNNLYKQFTYSNFPNAGQNFAVATWYMINLRNLSNTNALMQPGGTKPGTEQTPFVYYNTVQNDDAAHPDYYFHDSLPATKGTWTRTQAMVRRSGELVMILESNNNNPCDQTNQGTTGHRMRRLAARHGSLNTDKTNAYTNFAFFDGHVGLFRTIDFDLDTTVNNTGTGFTSMHNNTIGYLNNQ
jgi:prepilin-type N-terminal cleavage/methylation domain-containing protein/prepilin-type processing-associated H-X9-DG protein